ncbi:MAG: DMT family transporter [Pseudomonadota bacterium]
MTPADGASGGRTRSAGSANGIVMLSMLLWAAGFPSAEILLASWDPLALTTARLALATSLLLIVWAILDGPQALISSRWDRGVAVGGIGFGLGSFLVLTAQALTDPVSVAVIATTMPVVGAAIEMVLDGRRIRWPLAVGVSLAVVGGLMAAGARLMDGSYGFGAGLAFLSVVTFAWASRAIVRDLPDQTPIGRTAISLTGGLVVCSIVFSMATWLGFAGGPSAPIDAETWAHLALFAMGAMALSQFFWIAGVARLGIAMASMHMNLVPFYVMILMSALGEAWRWDQAAGAALVAVGALIAQWPSRPRSRNTA